MSERKWNSKVSIRYSCKCELNAFLTTKTLTSHWCIWLKVYYNLKLCENTPIMFHVLETWSGFISKLLEATQVRVALEVIFWVWSWWSAQKMVSSLGMAAHVTSSNNVLINQIMAVLEPAFCGTARTAAQTHTATYCATPELQPEAEIMQHFLSVFFFFFGQKMK